MGIGSGQRENEELRERTRNSQVVLKWTRGYNQLEGHRRKCQMIFICRTHRQYGDDLTVVNGTRVSFGKQVSGVDDLKDGKLIHTLQNIIIGVLWSLDLQFHIKAPVFVTTVVKHQLV